MDSKLRAKLNRIKFRNATQDEIEELEAEYQKTHPALSDERNRLGKMIEVKKELLQTILKDSGKIKEKNEKEGYLTKLGEIDEKKQC